MEDGVSVNLIAAWVNIQPQNTLVTFQKFHSLECICDSRIHFVYELLTILILSFAVFGHILI